MGQWDKRWVNGTNNGSVGQTMGQWGKTDVTDLQPEVPLVREQQIQHFQSSERHKDAECDILLLSLPDPL